MLGGMRCLVHDSVTVCLCVCVCVYVNVSRVRVFVVVVEVACVWRVRVEREIPQRGRLAALEGCWLGSASRTWLAAMDK